MGSRQFANATTSSGASYTSTYDFGFWKEPVVVGDFVWVDTNGNGIQDDGAASGLPGVKVTLLDENDNPVTADIQGNSMSSSQVTDGGGQYLFTNLKPGVYKVKFEVPSQYTVTATAAGTDTTLDSNGAMATSRRLEPGQSDLTLDLGLVRQLAPTTTAAPTTVAPTSVAPTSVAPTSVAPTSVAPTSAAPTSVAAIKGTVFGDQDWSKKKGPSEFGRFGVTVRLLDPNGRVIATTTTDANGDYSFDAPPGEYTVEIEVPSDTKATTPIRRNVAVKQNQVSAEVDFGVVVEGVTELALTGNKSSLPIVNFAACCILLGSIMMRMRARLDREN